MTTPAEALSSGTDQQQPALDRERVVTPERQTPGVAETSAGEQAGSADGGQLVFDRVAKLEHQLAAEREARVQRERQLEQEQQQRQQLEATLAHKREQDRVRQQRRRERNPEQMKKQHTEYMRGWRARKRREQGSSATGQQQPALDRLAEREGQLQGVQQAPVKPARRDQEAPDKQERRRAQNVAANRRSREHHGDAERQRNTEYKKAWRARRRQEQGLSPAVQPPPVVTREELERQLAAAQDKLKHQRERKAAQQQRYRQRHPEVGRRLNREWRARRRQNLSAESASEPPGLEHDVPASDPELVEQQRRRQRKAAYMREWRGRRRQTPA